MKSILFVCEYNACRSQMAEGLARQMLPQRQIWSAGLYPGALHEVTLMVMREIGIDISGHRSKFLDEVKHIHFDSIVVLAEPAFIPSLQVKAHERIQWFMPDPGLASETMEGMASAMRSAREHIRAKIEEACRAEIL